jgi:hypothetical protein
MNRTVIHGQLEIDHERGVIYFNSYEGCCILRVCNLPRPIPQVGTDPVPERMLDITHLIGQDWDGNVNALPGDPVTFKMAYPLVQRPAGDTTELCTVMKDVEQRGR